MSPTMQCPVCHGAGEIELIATTDLEVGSITITRTLTEDGDIVSSETSEGLDALTALGMIEMARDSILHPPDEEDA